MAMTPYNQLTNINRGMPEVAPAPTTTQMQPTKPNLRNIVNERQVQRQQQQAQNQAQRALNQAMRQNMRQQKQGVMHGLMDDLPQLRGGPGLGNDMPSMEQQQAMVMRMLQNLPPELSPMAVEANPQGYLTQQMMQQQQPGIPYYMQEPLQGQTPMQQPQAPYMPTVGMPQQQPQQMQDLMAKLQGMNMNPYQQQMPMQTPQPAGLGSLAAQKFNPSFGGNIGQPMGTQNTQLGNMGQPAQNTQPAFGGNMLGQKNAFS